MRRVFALVVLSILASAPSAAAGSIFLTDVKITAIDPPSTTFTGFAVTYNSPDITGLALQSSSEAPVTFGTNGTNQVDATFTATSFVEFTWLFTTSTGTLTDLGVDILGLSNQLKGANVDVTISAVPEPSSLVLLGAGTMGVAILGRRRLSHRRH